MANMKDYIWVFPIIAGILAFIAIVTPVASINLMGTVTANLWMWDLYIYNYGGMLVGTDFITEPMVMIPSLIATILIAIGGVGSLVSGITLKRNDKIRKVIIPSAILGILFILAELLWLILVPLNFPIESYLGPPPPGVTYDFWNINAYGISMSLHTVNFGVIGGFLAAGLAFGGAGAAYYYSKEREEKIPEKKEPKPPVEKTKPSDAPTLKFCPECGADIEDPSLKFCGKCGHEFKGIPMTQVQ